LEHPQLRQHFRRFVEWLAKATQKIDRQYIGSAYIEVPATTQPSRLRESSGYGPMLVVVVGRLGD
jgi:hypothetical protein